MRVYYLRDRSPRRANEAEQLHGEQARQVESPSRRRAPVCLTNVSGMLVLGTRWMDLSKLPTRLGDPPLPPPLPPARWTTGAGVSRLFDDEPIRRLTRLSREKNAKWTLASGDIGKPFLAVHQAIISSRSILISVLASLPGLLYPSSNPLAR